MRALLRRELTLVARDPALRHVLCAYLAALVLAALPLYLRILDSDAISSVAKGELLLSRLTAVQWVLASVLAPWVMLRLAQPEQGGALVRWIALSRHRPWKAVLARWTAGSVYLFELLAVTLPVFLLACAVSAARPSQVLEASCELFLFLAFLGLAVLPWGLAARPGGAAYLAAYLTLLALVAGRWLLIEPAGRPAATGAVLVAASVLALSLLSRNAGRLLYLDDETSR